MANYRVDDVVAARAGLQHGAGHVPERAQQAVAVLQLGDQSLAGERPADQLGAGLEHHVRRRCTAHRGELVAAQQYEVSMRLVEAAQGIGGDRVQVSFRGRRAQRLADRGFPGH